jgi:hypothetical protein
MDLIDLDLVRQRRLEREQADWKMGDRGRCTRELGITPQALSARVSRIEGRR